MPIEAYLPTDPFGGHGPAFHQCGAPRWIPVVVACIVGAMIAFGWLFVAYVVNWMLG